jgi:hypothetical protein
LVCLVESCPTPYDTKRMTRHRSPRLYAATLVALLALVPTFLSLGLHAGPESVSGPTLEPTTLYKSEHRSQGSEAHLHAEVGFESIFCLACFTSLRNQSRLTGETAFAAMSALGAFTAPDAVSSLASTSLQAFSSRAPPRA